jgi:hypothetical protein
MTDKELKPVIKELTERLTARLYEDNKPELDELFSRLNIVAHNYRVKEQPKPS